MLHLTFNIELIPHVRTLRQILVKDGAILGIEYQPARRQRKRLAVNLQLWQRQRLTRGAAFAVGGQDAALLGVCHRHRAVGH